MENRNFDMTVFFYNDWLFHTKKETSKNLEALWTAYELI